MAFLILKMIDLNEFLVFGKLSFEQKKYSYENH
jgi:hypothetical protein